MYARPAGIQAEYDPRNISRESQNILPETVTLPTVRTQANTAVSTDG